jgi:hypothetical protein
MSVIKQPFQMLPFYQDVESQWRFKEDAHKSLCDIPVIPKGKFIPFAIISDSDITEDIELHCWDDPYKYVRTESFTKNNCPGTDIGSVVSFSKTYYSNISPSDAEYKAMNDPLFYVEGQENANTLGTCTALETFYYLDGNNDIFTDGLGNRFIQ